MQPGHGVKESRPLGVQTLATVLRGPPPPGSNRNTNGLQNALRPEARSAHKPPKYGLRLTSFYEQGD